MRKGECVRERERVYVSSLREREREKEREEDGTMYDVAISTSQKLTDCNILSFCDKVFVHFSLQLKLSVNARMSANISKDTLILNAFRARVVATMVKFRASDLEGR